MSDESRMPDAYDRRLAGLQGLPDVLKAKPSTIRVVPPLGVGGSQTFVVQTYRQAGEGDTLFIEVVDIDGVKRLALPPPVTALIQSQHDALTSRARSKAAKAAAEDRKARGIQPGFMKGRRAS
jgi:hypothetical protein